MSPREKWERWQTQGHPTLGSKMPLVEYLVDTARWHVSSVIADDVRGRPINPDDVEQLEACFRDLQQLAREKGITR